MDDEVKNVEVEVIQEVKKTELEVEAIKEEGKPVSKSKKSLDVIVRWILTVIGSIGGLYMVYGLLKLGEIAVAIVIVPFVMITTIGAILMIIPLGDKKFNTKNSSLIVRYVVFFALTGMSSYVFLAMKFVFEWM